MGTTRRALSQGAWFDAHRQKFLGQMWEIDLVMRDRYHVAFIEVRYRGRSRFGNATSSVTLKKQQKIVRCAQLFLQTFPQMGEPSLPV